MSTNFITPRMFWYYLKSFGFVHRTWVTVGRILGFFSQQPLHSRQGPTSILQAPCPFHHPIIHLFFFSLSLEISKISFKWRNECVEHAQKNIKWQAIKYKPIAEPIICLTSRPQTFLWHYRLNDKTVQLKLNSYPLYWIPMKSIKGRK